jgi:hypothetical protein
VTRTGMLSRTLLVTFAVIAAAGLAALAVATTGTAAATHATPASDNPREIRSPGFLFAKGEYRRIQVRQARTHTYAHGISDRGRIAGGFDNPSFDGPNGMGHATVREPNGRFIRFDVPGAVSTIANKINDRGWVVGGYSPTSVSVGAAVPGNQSFLRYPGGMLRTIKIPGAVGSQALGVNNQGVVVGEYLDADGIFHGYRWRRGRLTTIDPRPTGGVVLDINDRGRMVGAYVDADGRIHGFLRNRRGRIRRIDEPGTPDVTFPFDINNRGQIVGSRLNYDAEGNMTSAHGFALRKGIDGRFTPIDFPGSLGTIPRGIDDQGRIVGIYGNPATAPAGARATRSLTGRPLGLPLTGEGR